MQLKAKKNRHKNKQKASFNTRRCDWRGGFGARGSKRSSVSIPEGAIEGIEGPPFVFFESQFQYPKVRLEAPLSPPPCARLRRFNTRRCDWRTKAADEAVKLADVSIPEGAIEGNMNPKLQIEIEKVSIPEGAIEGRRPVRPTWRIWSFNTRRCDWRITSFSIPAKATIVSIPEGAIEGRPRSRWSSIAAYLFQYSKVRLKACFSQKLFCTGIKFQYPKVRLKGTYFRSYQIDFVSFNTRRCDWRPCRSKACALPPKVSIPEGAIEGFSVRAMCLNTFGFNTRRCDWRAFLSGVFSERIKSFNTRRCDWRWLVSDQYWIRYLVSIPEGAIEGQSCFIHFRCLAVVSIPEGAIEGRSAIYTHTYTFTFQYPKVRLKAKRYFRPARSGNSFNTRRCDWRPFRISIILRNALVSIPEGAIEGCFLARQLVGPSEFQYPKVRLKDKALQI